MRWQPYALFAATAVAPACGNSASDPPAAPATLTCDWLRSASNCWETELKAIYSSCAVEPGAPAGTLAGDRSSCTYANGDTDTYTGAPAPADAGPLAAQGFGVIGKRKGKPCFTFEYKSDGTAFAFTLVGPSSKVVYGGRFSGDYEQDLSCADGTTVSAKDQASVDLTGCTVAGGSSASAQPNYVGTIYDLQLRPLPPGETGALTHCK
jgi:hypothetical protein